MCIWFNYLKTTESDIDEFVVAFLCNSCFFTFLANYPTDTVTVEVEALLTEGEIIPIPIVDPKPSLIPIFKCQFEDQSNGSYAYDVYWLICGNVIKYNTNLMFKDIADAIVLKETDWHDRYKMNMEVCLVFAICFTEAYKINIRLSI